MHSRSLMMLAGFAALTACADNAAGPKSSLSPSGVAASVSPQAQLVLHVDAAAPAGGDGSGRLPFQNLRDAVTLANESGGAMILMSPGTYAVTQTIRIETPVTIIGSNVMMRDSNGLPTGELQPGTEARILGTATLGANTMLFVSRVDGGIIRGAKIANVTIESVAGANANILLVKAQDFDVRDNLMRGPAALNISTAASSGQFRGNYIVGAGCGICIGGGNGGSPSTVDVRGNRVLGNRSGGVLLDGAGTDVPELADQLDATVENNDLSDNASPNGTGFGFRIFIIRRDLGLPVDWQSTGYVRAVVRNNRIVHNQMGIILDAGFPYRRVGAVCDPRTYTGGIDLTLKNNVIAGNTGTPALISFTRSVSFVNPAVRPLFQYLHNSTFNVSDPDGSLAGYLLDHPANDPPIPPPLCPNDLVSEPLGNHFLYNGVEIPAA